MIDLRSDTVTRPSPAMRAAMANAEVGDDVLDGDPTVRRLESTVAEMLGKDAALFFPSGTMANQAAVWVQTQPGTEILIDADAHIVHWEIAGAAALCGVQIRPVRGASPVMTAHDLESAIRPPSSGAAEPSLVCAENTHNGAGGAVMRLDALRAIREVAARAGVPLHLDGARLWNAAAAAGVTLAEFAACADTIMVSFSKGLGAPVGAMLVGDRDAIARAHRVRKRFGGGMRQSGILAAAALYALDHNLARLTDDHEAAQRIAGATQGIGGASVVAPDTNIVMIDLPSPRAEEVVARAGELGVRISSWHARRIRAVTHLDVSAEEAEQAGAVIARALAETLP